MNSIDAVKALILVLDCGILGGGSYRPSGSTPAAGEPATNEYFPQSTVITFNTIKPEAVISKSISL